MALTQKFLLPPWGSQDTICSLCLGQHFRAENRDHDRVSLLSLFQPILHQLLPHETCLSFLHCLRTPVLLLWPTDLSQGSSTKMQSSYAIYLAYRPLLISRMQNPSSACLASRCCSCLSEQELCLVPINLEGGSSFPTPYPLAGFPRAVSPGQLKMAAFLTPPSADFPFTPLNVPCLLPTWLLSLPHQ